MTDLDAMTDLWPPPDPSVMEREPRKCRRHEWERTVAEMPWPARCRNCTLVTEDPDAYFYPPDWDEDDLPDYRRCVTGGVHEADDRVRCVRCPAIRDLVRARRGKSSRRLGHDGERRSEKRYGWRKVGEYGGITDLEGTLAIVQQKTSRRAPPAAWMSIFRALEGRAGGRIPLVLLSFVRAGADTEDFVILRGRDWLQLHGKDEAP